MSQFRGLITQCVQPMHEKSSFLDTELTVAVHDAAGEIGAEAIAGSGWGLDHYAGERVIAAALLLLTPKGNEHRMALAITDRKSALAGWSNITGNFNGKGGAVAHAQIVGVEAKDGLLQSFVKVTGPNAAIEISMGEANGMLSQLYNAIGTVPPHARVEPPTPFVVPSESDPCGAQTAAAGLWVQDDRAMHMLQRIDGMVRGGQIDVTVGTDFVRRIMLAHRSRCGGPGMTDGVWLSPMAMNDFGHALTKVFGNPISQGESAPGRYVLDFRIPPNSDPFGPVLDGLGLASYFALGVGFSPGSLIAGALMKKRALAGIRVEFADMPSACGYRLFADNGPIEPQESKFAHRFHQTMLALAYVMLERRCEAGWAAPATSLL